MARSFFAATGTAKEDAMAEKPVEVDEIAEALSQTAGGGGGTGVELGAELPGIPLGEGGDDEPAYLCPLCHEGKEAAAPICPHCGQRDPNLERRSV
ncbi:MAG: hypothetical protein WEC33_00570 [Dehalococcoidia bacterium]